MVDKDFIDKLKEKEDKKAKEYDASYEVVQKAVELYKKSDKNKLDYRDLDLIYLLTIGEWSSSINNKISKIRKSNLLDNDKEKLINYLKESREKIKNDKYTKDNYGMFGTGFFSFKRADDKTPKNKVISNLIEMFMKIHDENSEEKCLEIADKYTETNVYGMGAGSLSQILHCIKPNVFPVLNSKGINIYSYLDIDLNNPSSMATYVENVKKIKEFRDGNFKFKNYRIIDNYWGYIEKKINKPKIKEKKKAEEENTYNNDQERISAQLNSKIDFDISLKIDSLHFPESMAENLTKRIETNLRQGKHIILTGPPGTGKSKLAKEIAETYVNNNYEMVTATSDWSTFDTIGGYRPDKSGNLEFSSGIFLDCFKNNQASKSKWLLIDEINRADIDKAFGPLFSALTGDEITLSFKDKSDNHIKVRPEIKDESREVLDNIYQIKDDWRIIATMNTFDKTSLYEMSYAFMRRFAFIPVSIPKTIDQSLMKNYLEVWKITETDYIDSVAKLWQTINKYRKIGPAIVEDIYKYLLENEADYISTIISYVMPQFEGIRAKELDSFKQNIKELDFIKADDFLLLESFIEEYFQLGGI